MSTGSKIDTSSDSPEDWSIELLRGVAATMVMFAHYSVYLLPGLNVGVMRFAMSGVDLFFVISGYVFAPYLLGKTIDPLPFFLRRFFRIYPLYATALLGYVALHVYQKLGTDHIISHLLFLHTTSSAETALYYNSAFWSLPPEIEFYFLLPFLSKTVRRTTSLVILALAALILHGWIEYMTTISKDALGIWARLGFHLPSLIIEFLLGSLAYCMASQSLNFRMRSMLLICGTGFWLILAIFFSSGIDKSILANSVVNMGVLSALSFAIMTTGWVGLVNRPPALLRSGAIILGNLSYGVYLFHNAIPFALKRFSTALSPYCFAALCLFCTISLAYIAHLFIESPLRQFGRNLASRVQKNRLESISNRA